MLLGGIAIGAGASLIAWRWPAARDLATMAAIVLVPLVLVAAEHYPPWAPVAVVGAMGSGTLGAWLGPVDGRRRGRGTLAVFSIAGIALALVYLSVPDTEGCVLAFGLVAALTTGWWLGHWDGGAAMTGASATGLAVLLVLVAGLGRGRGSGRISIDSWVAPKTAILAVSALVVVLAFRTNGRARPSQ